MTLKSRHAREVRLGRRLLWAVALAFGAALTFAACTSEQELRLSALHFFRQGNEAMARDDYPRAIRQYRRVISLDKSASAAHYNLGLAYFEMQEYENSVESFKTSLELQPGQAAAHYNLALTYDRLYNLPSAHAHYNMYRKLAQNQERNLRSNPAVAGKALTGGAAAGRPAATTASRPTAAIQSKPPGTTRAAGATSQSPRTSRKFQPVSRISTAGKSASARRGRTQTTRGDNSKWWIQDRYTRKP